MAASTIDSIVDPAALYDTHCHLSVDPTQPQCCPATNHVTDDKVSAVSAVPPPPVPGEPLMPRYYGLGAICLCATSPCLDWDAVASVVDTARREGASTCVVAAYGVHPWWGCDVVPIEQVAIVGGCNATQSPSLSPVHNGAGVRGPEVPSLATVESKSGSERVAKGSSKKATRSAVLTCQSVTGGGAVVECMVEGSLSIPQRTDHDSGNTAPGDHKAAAHVRYAQGPGTSHSHSQLHSGRATESAVEANVASNCPRDVIKEEEQFPALSTLDPDSVTGSPSRQPSNKRKYKHAPAVPHGIVCDLNDDTDDSPKAKSEEATGLARAGGGDDEKSCVTVQSVTASGQASQQSSRENITSSSSQASPVSLIPMHLTTETSPWLKNLQKRLIEDPTAVVGEIGLDGLKTAKCCMAAQRFIFEAQFSLAASMNRSVSVHSVGADGLMLEFLRSRTIDQFPRWVIMHGYGGSLGTALSLMRMSNKRGRRFFFGIGANTTLRLKAVGKLIQQLPNDRILVESDSYDRAEARKRVAAVFRAIKAVKPEVTEETLNRNATEALGFPVDVVSC